MQPPHDNRFTLLHATPADHAEGRTSSPPLTPSCASSVRNGGENATATDRPSFTMSGGSGNSLDNIMNDGLSNVFSPPLPKTDPRVYPSAIGARPSPRAENPVVPVVASPAAPPPIMTVESRGAVDRGRGKTSKGGPTARRRARSSSDHRHPGRRRGREQQNSPEQRPGRGASLRSGSASSASSFLSSGGYRNSGLGISSDARELLSDHRFLDSDVEEKLNLAGRQISSAVGLKCLAKVFGNDRDRKSAVWQ